MRQVVRVFWALLVGLASLSAQAVDILPTCMVSFNVKDKGFTDGQSTMSCRLVEARRVDLSKQILATKDTGEIDGAALAKQLDSLDSEIKKQQAAKNWIGLSSAVTGSALATIGLGACLETAGVGCLLAGVGKFMALHSLYDASSTDNDKAKQASAMRAAIADIRKGVVGKKSEAKTIRDRMIADANAMCTAVKDNCL